MDQIDIVTDALDVARRGGHAQKARADVIALKLVVADQGFESVDRALHVSVGLPQEWLALKHGRRPDPEAHHGHGEGAIAAARAIANVFVFQHGHAHARPYSCSNTATRMPGCSFSRVWAVAIPVKPPPTMATSTVASPWSGGLRSYGPYSASQRDSGDWGSE